MMNNHLAQLIGVAISMAFDTLVFGATLFKTYGHIIKMRKNKEWSIVDILLRDGES